MTGRAIIRYLGGVLTRRELDSESGATVLVCLEDLYASVARQVIDGTGVRLVITTSALEYQTRGDERVLGPRPAVMGSPARACGPAIWAAGWTVSAIPATGLATN